VTSQGQVSRQFTCSAASGSRARISSAALLFFVVMATANGVSPCLSWSERLMEGCDMSREMIMWCWFSMAMCRAVFPSASYNKHNTRRAALALKPNHLHIHRFTTHVIGQISIKAHIFPLFSYITGLYECFICITCLHCVVKYLENNLPTRPRYNS